MTDYGHVYPRKVRVWTFSGTTGVGTGILTGTGVPFGEVNLIPQLWDAQSGGLTPLEVADSVPFYWEIKNNDSTNYLRYMFANSNATLANVVAGFTVPAVAPAADPFAVLQPLQSYSLPWRAIPQQVITDSTVTQELAALGLYGITPAGVDADVPFSGVIHTWTPSIF